MTRPIQSLAGARLVLAPRRSRTTPKPGSQFSEVLRTGADVLLAGASAASGLVGGPILSTAIQAARSGLARTRGQTATGGAGSSPLGRAVGSGSGQAGGAQGGSGTSEVEAMRELQQQGQHENLQYLKLQQEVQQSNRRFSVASNLLKARHDTARAAINNLRA